jgi:hypothetical protein
MCTCVSPVTINVDLLAVSRHAGRQENRDNIPLTIITWSHDTELSDDRPIAYVTMQLVFYAEQTAAVTETNGSTRTVLCQVHCLIFFEWSSPVRHRTIPCNKPVVCSLQINVMFDVIIIQYSSSRQYMLLADIVIML